MEGGCPEGIHNAGEERHIRVHRRSPTRGNSNHVRLQAHCVMEQGRYPEQTKGTTGGVRDATHPGSGLQNNLCTIITSDVSTPTIVHGGTVEPLGIPSGCGICIREETVYARRPLIVHVLVHIDDYIIATNQPQWKEYFIDYYNQHCEINDLGKLDMVVGIPVEWGDDINVTLCRKHQLEQTIRNANLGTANPQKYRPRSKAQDARGMRHRTTVPKYNG
jgi:hypothetical protein